MGAERTWYNDRKAGIIPAHTGFCVHRRNPGAKIRRRPMAAERTWNNIHNVNIISAHAGFRVYRGNPGAKFRRWHVRAGRQNRKGDGGHV